MIYSLARNLLFRLDAEDVHDLAMTHMQRIQQSGGAMRAIAAFCAPPEAAAREVWGLRFPSPLGIAAGFDKNGLVIPFLSALGFGFLEVGTVTLHPQPGNPRPRLFRYAGQRALVNRMGFNNDGADAVSERLRRWAATAGECGPPLFINVGKNLDVPIDRAAQAYAQCYAKIARWSDGVVLNLSSPNTPSLRSLQRPEHLERLLRVVRSVREEITFVRGGSHPILVKIAPDLSPGEVREICEVCRSLVDGVICTNTTTSMPAGVTETGGLSGAPLFESSTTVLATARAVLGREYRIIGAGGIFDVADARAKLDAGADLLQVYTGFVYEGPGLPRRLARQLSGGREEGRGAEVR